LVLSDKNSYGEVWKITDSFNGQINGSNQSTTAYHYYSRNIGKIRQTFGGQNLDLIEFRNSYENNLSSFGTRQEPLSSSLIHAISKG